MMMNMKGVIEATQISETCIRRMERQGRFPRSALIGRRRYWKTEDVQKWVDRQMNGRGGEAAEKPTSWFGGWT